MEYLYKAWLHIITSVIGVVSNWRLNEKMRYFSYVFEFLKILFDGYEYTLNFNHELSGRLYFKMLFHKTYTITR